MSENIFFDTSELKYLGKGAIIGKTVRIRKPELVSIGDHSIIDDFTYIPCELTIGKYSHVGANTTFIGGSGRVEIGSFVNIAPGSQIITGSNHFSIGGLVSPTLNKINLDDKVIKEVLIQDHVLLGVQCVVFPGCNLPEGMSVGALSLIKDKVYKPWTLYAGIPIREIGDRKSDLILSQANELINRETE